MTDATDVASVAPTATDTARSADTAERLLLAALACGMCGWLAGAAICLGVAVWTTFRAAGREERRLRAELAALDAERRPLRRIVATERLALARHAPRSP